MVGVHCASVGTQSHAAGIRLMIVTEAREGPNYRVIIPIRMGISQLFMAHLKIALVPVAFVIFTEISTQTNFSYPSILCTIHY